MPISLETISRQFAISGRYQNSAPLGAGHINDTFIAAYRIDGQTKRYVHQRINDDVFAKPELVMANLEIVTRHQQKVLADQKHPDIDRARLQIVLTIDKKTFHIDSDQKYWRTLHYIEDTRTHEVAKTPGLAHAAARAFGRFHKNMAGLAADRLVETITDFHHTARRYTALEQAIAEDSHKRAAACSKEIDFALARNEIATTIINLMAKDQIPTRIAHNDAKLNNVLFDKKSGESVCVIDLDTVMPGSVLYDFGGLVRTMVSPGAEDSRDLNEVVVRRPMFEALVAGYLAETGGVLNTAEQAHLVFAGRLITLEDGLRFLTDYLKGDRYYKTSRPGHNLDRCRTQFALVAAIEADTDPLQAIVDRHIR